MLNYWIENFLYWRKIEKIRQNKNKKSTDLNFFWFVFHFFFSSKFLKRFESLLFFSRFQNLFFWFEFRSRSSFSFRFCFGFHLRSPATASGSGSESADGQNVIFFYLISFFPFRITIGFVGRGNQNSGFRSNFAIFFASAVLADEFFKLPIPANFQISIQISNFFISSRENFVLFLKQKFELIQKKNEIPNFSVKVLTFHLVGFVACQIQNRVRDAGFERIFTIDG